MATVNEKVGIQGDSSTSAPTIQLNWERKDGNVVVTPSDHDRFVVKVGKAVEILRQNQRQQQMEKQFDVLVKRLASWLASHSESVASAYLTAGESILRFIVVRNRTRFESEVTDALSDLSVEIANDPDLDLIKLAARALPKVSDEELQSFLDPSFTIPFHGKRT